MKKNLFKYLIMGALAVAAVSCDNDDVCLGAVDNDRLEVPGNDVVYITDHQGNRHFTSVEFRDNATFTLNVISPNPLAADATVNFSIDPQALADYNTAHSTSYEALPASAVSFAGSGDASIAAGSSSASVSYTLTSDGSLDPGKTYAFAVRATISGGAQLGATDATRVIFVRDLTAIPSATKYVTDADGNLVEGVKMFNCIEANNTNPLQTLSLTLRNSGKPLYDAVILFSSNINFDSSTGEVYIFHNENVRAILDNTTKYLKPLRDRGIKVILSILGNHDKSGVANLNDATARKFAQQIKQCCDAYGLDGVMLDDEYSNYETNPVPPGFVAPSVDALSRLYYEIKKAMPDRWTISYGFARAAYMNPVRDLETGATVNPGTYMDYVFANYPDTPTSNPLISNYPGITPRQLGYCSQEFHQGGSLLHFKSELKSTYAAGYGCNLVFAQDLNTNANPAEAGNTRWQALQDMAEVFYGDEVVWDGTRYTKDWK